MIRCLISNDFETKRHESTLEYLGRYFDNSQRGGMSREQYLEMCSQMNLEIEPDKIPPIYEDFPSYVHVSLDIFNALPDRFSGGMSSIYTGKDLASLEVLFHLYRVEPDEQMKVFDTIGFLDSRARKQAIRDAERANKKSGRK